MPRRRGLPTRPGVAVLALSVAASLAAGSAIFAQQLLDRIVARVGGAVITQTDVEAALALGVVDAEQGADRLAAATQALIDRHLLLAEVSRFPPVEPPAADVDAEVARMRLHAGPGLPALVERTGLDEARIREMARDTLRIRAYLDQRFGTTAQVTLQEARDYYEAHRQEFARNGAVRPFEEVEAAVRTAASAERRRRNVEQWIADLRTRGDVVVMR